MSQHREQSLISKKKKSRSFKILQNMMSKTQIKKIYGLEKKPKQLIKS